MTMATLDGEIGRSVRERDRARKRAEVLAAGESVPRRLGLRQGP